MRTDIVQYEDDDRPIGRGDLITYYHPREIVSDDSLPIYHRRKLLAFWLSDANALPSAPSIRSSGRTTATVDELMDALLALDELETMISAPSAISTQQTVA